MQRIEHTGDTRPADVRTDEDFRAAVLRDVRRRYERTARPVAVECKEIGENATVIPAEHADARLVLRSGRGDNIRKAIAVDIADRDPHATAIVLVVCEETIEFLAGGNIEGTHVRSGPDIATRHDDRAAISLHVRCRNEHATRPVAVVREELGSEPHRPPIEDANERRYANRARWRAAGCRDNVRDTIAVDVGHGDANATPEVLIVGEEIEQRSAAQIRVNANARPAAFARTDGENPALREAEAGVRQR